MTGPFGDLPARFEPTGPSRGVAVVLPGLAYSPAAPCLEFARQALLQHGFTVQQVWWDTTTLEEWEDPEPWVRGHVEKALGKEEADHVVLVAKSLGTWAASYAAERGLDAIWFTPLLVEPALAEAIGANPGRQLLVGGLVDQAWDSAIAHELADNGCDLLELPDAEHPLWVSGDAVRSAEIQLEVARATDAFLRSLA